MVSLYLAIAEPSSDGFTIVFPLRCCKAHQNNSGNMFHHYFSIMKYFLPFCCMLIMLQSCAQPLQSDASYILNNYTKKEFRITMRDGVKLFTSVYIPKDTAQQ